MRGVFTRADKILIVALILVSAAGYPVIKLTAPKGSFLAIEVGGERTMVVSMDDYRDIEVMGKLGVSTIRIDEKGARFVDSPCADKTCVKSAPIKDAGEIAACVPNGVMIRVLGNNDEDVDVISR
jgi:hypothetical protein